MINHSPSVLNGKLAYVLKAILECLGHCGENDRVDLAIVQVMQSVLSNVTEGQLQSHSELMVAYLMSSFSHMKMQPRIVGLQLFDLCMEMCPNVLFSVFDSKKNFMKCFVSLVRNNTQIYGLNTKQKIWHSILLWMKWNDNDRESIEEMNENLSDAVVSELLEFIPSNMNCSKFIGELLEVK